MNNATVTIEGVDLEVWYNVSEPEESFFDNRGWPPEITVDKVLLHGEDLSSFVQPYDTEIMEELKKLHL